MEFKINEDFAKHYNEYRQKEEYQKLKSRYGDVKLADKKKNKKKDDDDLGGSQSFASDDASSSSSSDSDSEWEEKEHEDFLRLYDALCRDDPALKDQEKVWFRPKPEGEKAPEGEKPAKPVHLKDHAREFLLSHGGVDDEAQAAEAKTLSKIDTLSKLQGKDAQAQKQSFLA